MKCTTYVMRKGYDGKKCFVHARMCHTPEYMLATAQYLDVTGCDLFGGIYMARSFDEGKTWTELIPQEGLVTTEKDGVITGNCDGTPMYHKKTGKVLLLGHKVEYLVGAKDPGKYEPATFYSVYNEETDSFSNRAFLELPKDVRPCGNGSGQALELENGDILVPVQAMADENGRYAATVLLCSFDGEKLTFKEKGNDLRFEVARGLCEPSLIYHDGTYYMTIRNDEAAFVAKSKDGMYYEDMHLWTWEDGSLLQSYNTQQHWAKVNGELYLVYTRRDETNNHVERHRAPLWMAKVEDMHLVKSTEMAITPQRGARMGNFGVISLDDGRAMAMVAEWMQPIGCEKYGSDNSIFVSVIEE